MKRNEPKTKIFNLDKSERSSATNYEHNYEHNDNKYAKYFNYIKDVELSSTTPVRIPIVVTLDLSGSMYDVFDSVKHLFKAFTQKLMEVDRHERTYTLIVVLINNKYKDKAEFAFVGDIEDFNCDEFIRTLPEPNGSTPLGKSFIKVDCALKSLYKMLEEENHWYTIPVYFTITDANDNGDIKDVADAISRYKKDIEDSNKIFVEFVTEDNPNGFSLGGYCVNIDGDDKEKRIVSFADALKTASSSNQALDGNSTFKKRPRKSDRKAFNKYYSDMLVYNFQICFERLLK